MKKLLLAAILSVLTRPALAFDMDNCTVYFSPKGGVTDALVAYIKSAEHTINLLAYNFTSTPIAQALVEASNRGVFVEVILDRSVPTERNSALPQLNSAHNVSIWVDKAHKIAHNKVILVDGSQVETGSFNYSPNAENFNGENALLCHSEEAFKLYKENFDKHKSHSVRIQ